MIGVVDVTPLSPSDREDLDAFYRRQLDHGERVIQLYDWWAGYPREAFRIRTFVAKVDGRIVGALNAIPVELTVHGRRVTAAWQQNSIVSAAARGQGIGRQLVERAAEEWQVLLAKGTSAPMYRLRKAAGFQDVPNSNFLAHFTRPSGLQGSGWRRLAGLVGWARSRGSLWRFQTRATRGDGSVRVEEVDHIQHELAATTTNDGRFVSLVKEQSYLQWRYRDCPGRTYAFLLARRVDRPVGLLVLRFPREEGRPGWIVDLLVDPADGECVELLVAAGIERMRGGGVPSIRTFATLPAIRRRLHRLGFVDLPSTPHFTYRAREDELTASLRTAEWNFWHGDGDLDLY